MNPESELHHCEHCGADWDESEMSEWPNICEACADALVAAQDSGDWVVEHLSQTTPAGGNG